MGPGDLVKVVFRDSALVTRFPQYHKKVGIITKFAWRGHIPVWWVSLENGQLQNFEEMHLVEVK